MGVRLEAGRFHLPVTQAHQGAALMCRWYTETGGQWLRRRIQPWAARLGKQHVDVEIRDLGYRWGSARLINGPQHINIHWATLQLPPSLIDYVLVHELAHLRETNHIADYLVARGMPFREAHGVSARLSIHASDTGRTLSDLTMDDYRQSSDLFDEDVLEITVDSSIEDRDVPGGGASAQVAAAIETAEGSLEAEAGG